MRLFTKFLALSFIIMRKFQGNMLFMHFQFAFFRIMSVVADIAYNLSGHVKTVLYNE